MVAATKQVPDKGEHQIRYYGWYSNKNKSLRKNTETGATPTPDVAVQVWEKLEPGSSYIRRCRINWDALIKTEYEAKHRACRSIDPLKCPLRKNCIKKTT